MVLSRARKSCLRRSGYAKRLPPHPSTHQWYGSLPRPQHQLAFQAHFCTTGITLTHGMGFFISCPISVFFHGSTYGDVSIPIDTFLVGWTSIYHHLPAILGFTRYQGFDPSTYINSPVFLLFPTKIPSILDPWNPWQPSQTFRNPVFALFTFALTT